MTAAVQPGAVRAGVLGTALTHGGLLLLVLLFSHRAKPVTSIVYEVNLVAAPLAAPTPRDAAPEATPAAPEEVAPVVQPKVTKPVPKPPPPVDAKRVDKTPVTRAPVTPAQGEAPSTGQDVVTLHQAGIAFPYPEYLRNIENAIFARWNHSMARPGLDAKIVFVILKDGSVDPASIEVLHGSGNYTFDTNAQAAIQAASAARAFHPLPSGFNGASLPIEFDFQQVAKGAP